MDPNYRIDLPDEEICTLFVSKPQGIKYTTLLAYG